MFFTPMFVLYLYDCRISKSSVFGYGDNVHGSSWVDIRHYLPGVRYQSSYILRHPQCGCSQM